MITLAATHVIGGKAGAGSSITYSIFGMELASGTETYKVLAQGTLGTSAAALYTVPGSTTAFVKKIVLASVSTATTAILYAGNGTAAGNQITGTITIPTNGMLVFDDTGMKVFDSNGSISTKISSITATALSTDSVLPDGTTATTQTYPAGNTKVATTGYVDAAFAAHVVGHQTIQQFTVDLGTPRRSGTFDITGGTGWIPGRQVIVQMAGNRPNQTLTDTMQMDNITATGVVVNSSTIKVYWKSKTFVSNQYVFNYWFAY